MQTPPHATNNPIKVVFNGTVEDLSEKRPFGYLFKRMLEEEWAVTLIVPDSRYPYLITQRLGHIPFDIVTKEDARNMHTCIVVWGREPKAIYIDAEGSVQRVAPGYVHQWWTNIHRLH